MRKAKTPRTRNAKGKAGAKDVASFLSAFYDDDFTPNKRGVKGSDIKCPAWFTFSVEVKNEAVRLRHLLYPTAKVRGWWEQALTQAQTEGKQPALFVKVESVWYARTDASTIAAPCVVGDTCAWVTLENWCLANRRVHSAT